jgi:phytoene dehydrogenase-like protein
VLEKHYLWGGLNSFYKRAGRRFDTGLHALTNYAPPDASRRTLARLLRQLSLSLADLALAQQSFSVIAFPDLRVRFSNDAELLDAEVARAFPRSIDAFRELWRFASEIAPDAVPTGKSARAELLSRLRDERLADVLLLPVCLYGSAQENDCDWHLFVVLFRAIFVEGLARPEGGIKPLLDLLVRRLRELGGELRMRAGVERILVEGGRAAGVRLESGEEIRCERVLSCAGWVETMRLCGEDVAARDAGWLSFVESVSVLDREPRDLGIDATIVFFNDAEELLHRRPAGPTDPRIGAISCPNNYENATPLDEGVMRVTTLANTAAWRDLDEEDYARQKQAAFAAAVDVAARYAADPRPHTRYLDVFTPRTVERFTSHAGGAVYGSPRKCHTGETPVGDLFLCGTDQGFPGIVGALHSGVLMANRHVLTAKAALR